jgi:hypothetical protein
MDLNPDIQIQVVWRRTELPSGGYVIKHHDGKEFWRNANRKFHREDGPAIIEDSIPEWWLNGKPYSEEDWKQMLLLKPFWDK